MAPMIISIEGSIGAGKTTFLQELAKVGYRVIYEPVDEWSKEMLGDKSIFELYYQDKHKYGFAFQMYVLQSRVQLLRKVIETHPNDIIITERSTFTDHKVFAQMMYDQEIIDEYSYRVYLKWYAFLQDILPPISGLVYLRVTPETCVQRIMKRKRNGEGLIDLKYMDALQTKHEEWLMNENNDVPVCVIDGNGNIPRSEHMSQFVQKLVQNVR